MIMTINVFFDEQEWAADIINCLYDMLENGSQKEDWEILTEDHQKTLVKEILAEAVRQVKEG